MADGIYARTLTAEGSTYTIAQWATALGLRKNVIYERLSLLGRNERDAVFGRPSDRDKHNVVFFLNEDGIPFPDQNLYQNGTKDPICYTPPKGELKKVKRAFLRKEDYVTEDNNAY